MRVMRKNSLGWVFAALYAFSTWSSRALNPGLPPGSNFDLSHWYLQLPTIGGVLTNIAGSVDSAAAEQLVAGFTNAYFYTGPDGAMTFWVPDDGATTGGSTHPRSELREELVPGNTDTNWTLYGNHLMTATCVVTKVPTDTQKVCIGQIHEPNNRPDGSSSSNNEQMIMFDLANHEIYANINLDGNQSSSFSVVFNSGSSVALGRTNYCTMAVVEGVLTIVINSVTNSWNLFSGTNYQGHIAQNWDAASGNTVYFKAGDYNQTGNACDCATDGAQVAYYSLSTYHAAAITNPPAGVIGAPGGNATFSVGAMGNGSLSYQWLMNGTNLLAGATSSSLTLSNLSAVNLGNYSVVVSDSTPDFGSITSSVAMLSGNFPPVITNPPVSQTVGIGGIATFSVGEDGFAPLTNRWVFNTNSTLAGAPGATLTITNAQATNAGNYFDIVSDPYGAVTSAVVTLTVELPPAITNPPANQTAVYGGNVSFAVGASGTPPLTFTWWFDGTNQIAITTNGLLALSGVSGANAGNYSVVITNNFGAVTSVVASLSLNYSTVFTNAGATNWICPAGISAVQVECWGGGGAGGSAFRNPNSSSVQYGGGGAGGAYARKISYPVTPGDTYYVVIGAGGVAATGTLTNGFKVPGGDSWFNTVNAEPVGAGAILAPGGDGGQCAVGNSPATAFGAGGLSSTNGCLGDVLFAGGNGGTLSSSTGFGGSGGGSGGTAGNGNPGGTNGLATMAVLGGGPGGAPNPTSGNSGPGQAPVAGPGGGGGGSRATAQQTGGNGAAGQVIITCILPPVIAGVAVTNQMFQINCGGTPFISYLVLAKTNLTDPLWLPIGTNVTGSNGTAIFMDASLTNSATRFYRLAAP